jgi:hypothetical protein
VIRASPYYSLGRLPILSFLLIVALHFYPSLHRFGVYGIYVFFCTCMPSSRLAPTHTRSLGRSVVHQSFLFFYSSFLIFLSLALACCCPQPRSLRFSVFFHTSRFSLLSTFSASVLPICLFSVHTTLYKISRISLQNAKPCCRDPNPIYCITPLMNSSTTLYQSAIHQDDNRMSRTSTPVCKTLALSLAAS